MHAPALLLALAALAGPADDEPLVLQGPAIRLTRAEYGEWLVGRVGVPLIGDYLVEMLAIREAERRGLSPTDEEIRVARAEETERVIKYGYNGNPEKFWREKEALGYSREGWIRRREIEMRAELSMFAIIRADRDLGPEALAQAFAERYGPEPEHVVLEALYFSAYRVVDPDAAERPDLGALKQAALARASAAAEALQRGAPLAELLPASDPASDLLVQEGRIDGWRPRQLGAEVDRAVAYLDEPGDVTPAVATFDGAWVLRLVERRPVTLEQARDELLAAERRRDVDGGELATLRARLLAEADCEVLLK